MCIRDRYNRADIYSYIKENPDKTVPDYRHVQTVFHYVNQDEGRLLIPANTLIATAVTDEEGRAVFTEDLPLGQYYIREMCIRDRIYSITFFASSKSSGRIVTA